MTDVVDKTNIQIKNSTNNKISEKKNYSDIHNELNLKFTKKNTQLISIIMNHFLENDYINQDILNEIKGKYKIKWNGRFICSLQNYTTLNIWLKKYQMKYGSIVRYDQNKSQCILNKEWRTILDTYKEKYVKEEE